MVPAGRLKLQTYFAAARRAHAAARRDWDVGVIQISMMGFQGQAVVGTAAGLLQSVYLVQFGAQASILSAYCALTVLINAATSFFAVAVLVRLSMRHSFWLFFLGCFISMAASVALTFPPAFYEDAHQQAAFVSHYFGILCVVANASAKFRDYPLGLAKVYLLQSTESRASENAYNKIFDVMVGNGLNGALMLSMLASPTANVRALVAALQIGSTVISLRGSTILAKLHDRGDLKQPTPGMIIGARSDQEVALEGVAQQEVRMASTFGDLSSLAVDTNLWQLLAIEWCAGFIFTLNSQAAGTIYWSSVVGVSDNMRSVYIGLESALGGALIGFVTTLYVTRLYHQQADVSIIIPRIVSWGAALGGCILAFFGTTSGGALLGITSLYLYYFIFAWSNIEFLKLMDTMREKDQGDRPLLCMYLMKDIASGLLNNTRNMVLMWLLAATGFYERDCNIACAAAEDVPDCVTKCHEQSHASIGHGTVVLVRALYVLVTPGAYLFACFVIRRYSAISTPGLKQRPL